MNPNIISGQAIGGTVAVRDSAELTLLSIQGMLPGTSVWNVAEDSFFVLTVSTATLSSSVVEVGGYVGYRWVKGGGGGSGGGPWLNPSAIYVSPLGDDANDGTGWTTPVKSGYVGYYKLYKAHGGTLHMANGVQWVPSDPAHFPINPDTGRVYDMVAGQGMWFRNDPVGSPVPNPDAPLPIPVNSVAGFLLAGYPIVIQGYGADYDGLGNPFEQPGIAIIGAGSNLAVDNRTKPGLWVTYNISPIFFYDIRLVPLAGYDAEPSIHYNPYRAGWDYNRVGDATGTIAYQTIHTAQRAAGLTTFTVDLSPAVTIPVLDVSLNPSTYRYQSTNLPGNPWVVHCTFHRQAAPEVPPWGAGAGIYFDTADGQFTPGIYTVAWSAATTLAASDWSIEFVDGSSTPATSTHTATIRSTVAKPSGMDYIEVEGNSSNQFPATVYPVTSVTVTSPTQGTITVTDIYGGYDGINATQGPDTLTGYRLAHQERDLYMTAGSTRFYNCTSRASQNPASLFRMGPMFDFGSCTAFGFELHSSYIQGYKPPAASGIPYDDVRLSAVSGHGGLITPFGAIMSELTGQQASIRAIMGSTLCALEIHGYLFDTDGNGEPPAAFVIDGDAATTVTVDGFTIVADSAGAFGSTLNTIRGVPPHKIRGVAAVTLARSSVAPSDNYYELPGSPWVGDDGIKVATWAADLQISGKHPAGWRQISPTSKRFVDIARQASAYSPVPTTTGVADPMGGNGAVSYTAGPSPDVTNIFIYSFDSPITFAAGDRLVVGGWVNSHGAGFSSGGFLLGGKTFSSDVIWNTSGTDQFSVEIPAQVNGWQYASAVAKVVSANGSAGNLQVIIIGPDNGSGGVLDLFGWNVYYIPEADATDTDVYEFAGTLRSAPHYLQPGQAGTFEGQPFIAHGGIGFDSALVRTVGVGSGQLTLGATVGYFPVLAADGTTIIAWVLGTAATVNP